MVKKVTSSSPNAPEHKDTKGKFTQSQSNISHRPTPNIASGANKELQAAKAGSVERAKIAATVQKTQVISIILLSLLATLKMALITVSIFGCIPLYIPLVTTAILCAIVLSMALLAHLFFLIPHLINLAYLRKVLTEAQVAISQHTQSENKEKAALLLQTMSVFTSSGLNMYGYDKHFEGTPPNADGTKHLALMKTILNRNTKDTVQHLSKYIITLLVLVLLPICPAPIIVVMLLVCAMSLSKYVNGLPFTGVLESAINTSAFMKNLVSPQEYD